MSKISEVLSAVMFALKRMAGPGRRLSLFNQTIRLISFAIVGSMVLTNAHAQPIFSKVFAPDIIGPGSVSTLMFTIDNSAGGAVSDLAFTDALPTGVTIAAPANASTTCSAGTVTALGGGSTISLSGGQVGAGGTCTVSVNVISSTVATHMNISGDLTSSAGNSGTASDDLTVATDRPGFSKSFSPTAINIGSRSTLTFTIDNSANGASLTSLTFTDNFPTGLEIGDPANAATTCDGPIGLTLTAIPATSVVSFTAFGFASPGFEVLLAGATCTITVDVIGTGIGMLDNVTGDLTASSGSSGKASATIEVTADALSLTKAFTDDPVPAGGTVTLEFTITNFDRDFPATGIAFSDDLDATLTGLAPSSLPSAPCGGISSLAFVAGVLSLSNGDVPANGGSCTFSVSLDVPAGTAAGAYPNTTSSITGDVGGSMVTGSPATETLFIEPAPILTKEFIGDPVSPGGSVTIHFEITNTSTTSAATDIAFVDELTTFFPFPISATLPAAPCGGSISLIGLGEDMQGISLTGGSVGIGGSCMFDVTLDVPASIPSGTYVNTTEEITATVDGATRTGSPATDSLDVVAPPDITKAFIDDPVGPGDTVTLEFTLTHGAESPADAVGIGFTDDLSFLSGLTATGLPLSNLCGSGNGTLSGSIGDTFLTFSGATLAPDDACTFSVTLSVPGAAPVGSYTNTTSAITATVGGLAVSGNMATDNLDITTLLFTKAFTNDPVIAGGTATLEFTIENTNPSVAVGSIVFTDNLDDALTGLVATGSPTINTCGGALSGTNLLIYSGGSLAAATSCSISVEVLVPAGTASNTYTNTTSILSTDSGTAAPATDALVVNSNLLSLTKEFTDDPVAPGDAVTLQFKLKNLDATTAATAIGFTDDLGAALSGLVATVLPPANSACNGSGTLSGAGLLTFTGGSLAAGDSCTFSATLTVPSGISNTVATNTTSGVMGTIGGLAVTGDPATDGLQVSSLTFSKAFDGPTPHGGTSKLTFTITNGDAFNSVSNLAFSDNLDDVISGLVATSLPSTPCGSGSVLGGTSFLIMTGGNLGPSESCTFDVDLLVPESALDGSYLNTTSDLVIAGLPVANPASATLIVGTPVVAFRVERTTGDVFAQGIFVPGGADMAERINVSEPVEFGDVVELDPTNPGHYRKARGGSNLVAGVITTEPGFILGNNLEEGQQLMVHSKWSEIEIDGRPSLALLGRVPVKTTTENGQIHPGDLLTVSKSRPGYAMRCAEAEKCEGAFIGKALKGLERGEGLILVLVASH